MCEHVFENQGQVFFRSKQSPEPLLFASVVRGDCCALGTIDLDCVLIGVCLQGIAVSAPHQEMRKMTLCAWTLASARLENAFPSARESRSWSLVHASVSGF